ncbi:MAG: hypothetical protein IIC09_07660 [Proteobacteria bacterium]|nr:hypothetical protein [Pseudomonadota bacterium]
MQPYIEQARLFRVEGAPGVQRPVYMVYPSTARSPQALELALSGMREIVSSP